MAGWSESNWDRLLQQQETLYLQYHNDYGHQTWQGSDLSWGGSIHKIVWPFDHVVFAGSRDKLISMKLHYQSDRGNQTWQDGSSLW